MKGNPIDILNLINLPTLETELHMLRHFMNIEVQLLEKLLESGISDSQVDKYLSEPGSRFYPDFAFNTKQLFIKALENKSEITIGENGNYIFFFQLSKIDYPGGVGTKSVVDLKAIPENERRNIFIKNNRGFPLQHFTVKELPSANEFVMILKPFKERFIFITAFPGSPAMPIPDQGMGKEFFEKCKLFWDNHVFLVKS